MNIFYLHNDPETCAKMHNDKHVVKMILEYCQLMCTAHRVLDGTFYYGQTANGRKIQRWLLSDNREDVLWKASHIKHPSGIWVRDNRANYNWLFWLWVKLMDEYSYRYGKQHSARRMVQWLINPPKNMTWGYFFEPTPAMPDEYKVKDDSIQSYRNYYLGDKQHLASWKKREMPEWYKIS